MVHGILALYDRLFARKALYRWHLLLFHLGARGMGVMTNPERAEEFFLRKFLRAKPNALVLDIGASNGRYAARVRKFSKAATIYCLEPHPLVYHRLEARKQELNILPFRLACASSAGARELYDNAARKEGTGKATFYRDVLEDLLHVPVTRYPVDCTTLDAFATSQNISYIDLLKIDTEGAEMEVLKGAAGLLSQERIGVIQFEFNVMNVASRTFMKDFLDYLEGFRLYRVMQDGFLPIHTYYPPYHELFGIQTIIAIHPGSGFKI